MLPMEQIEKSQKADVKLLKKKMLIITHTMIFTIKGIKNKLILKKAESVCQENLTLVFVVLFKDDAKFKNILQVFTHEKQLFYRPACLVNFS